MTLGVCFMIIVVDVFQITINYQMLFTVSIHAIIMLCLQEETLIIPQTKFGLLFADSEQSL